MEAKEVLTRDLNNDHKKASIKNEIVFMHI